jgi:hypothetical protein
MLATSGAHSQRLAEVTPRARSAPDRMCAKYAGRLSIATRTLPAGQGSVYSTGGTGTACFSSPYSITGRVNGGRLILGVITSTGGGGDRRREFVLAQSVGEATDTTLSTGLARSDIAAASPPAPPVRAAVSLQPTDNDPGGCHGRLTALELAIYPNRVEARLRMWSGWETFPVGADGAFSGRIIGPTTMSHLTNTGGATRLAVCGNVKSKEMRLELLGASGNAVCTYAGTIS